MKDYVKAVAAQQEVVRQMKGNPAFAGAGLAKGADDRLEIEVYLNIDRARAPEDLYMPLMSGAFKVKPVMTGPVQAFTATPPEKGGVSEN